MPNETETTHDEATLRTEHLMVVQNFKTKKRIFFVERGLKISIRGNPLRDLVYLKTRKAHLSTNVPFEEHRKLIKFTPDIELPRSMSICLRTL